MTIIDDSIKCILIFEPRLSIVPLWKNNIGRLWPNARMKVVSNNTELHKMLNSPLYEWSAVISNWDNEESESGFIFAKKNESSSICRQGFIRVSIVRSHDKYKDIPIFLYTERKTIKREETLFIKESNNTQILYSRAAPYGIIEKVKHCICKQWISSYTNHEKSLIEKVREAINFKEFDSALTLLSKIPVESTNVIKISSMRFECFVGAGMLKEAQSLFSYLLVTKAITPDILALAAEMSLKEGDSERALNLIEVKNKIYPDSGHNRIAMAIIYRSIGNKEEAKSVLMDELLNNPLMKKNIYSELCSLLVEDCHYKEILLLSQDKDFYIKEQTLIDLFNKVRITVESGSRFDISIQVIEKFLPKIKDSKIRGGAFNTLGLAYEKSGNTAEAINCYARSLSELPEFIPSVRALLRVLPIHRASKDVKSYSKKLLQKAIAKRVRFLSIKLDIILDESEDVALSFFKKTKDGVFYDKGDHFFKSA